MGFRGDGSLPAKPNKWIALTVVCLIVFVICINTTAINTAVATIADELSLSTSTLGWALDEYMLAAAALVVHFAWTPRTDASQTEPADC